MAAQNWPLGGLASASETLICLPSKSYREVVIHVTDVLSYCKKYREYYAKRNDDTYCTIQRIDGLLNLL